MKLLLTFTPVKKHLWCYNLITYSLHSNYKYNVYGSEQDVVHLFFFLFRLVVLRAMTGPE